MQPDIVLLGQVNEDTPAYYFNAMKKHYQVVVILENKPSKKKLIKNRFKKLGLKKVIGQLMFQVFIQKTLHIISKKRIEKIKQEYDLDSKPIPVSACHYVTSINHNAARQLLKGYQPKVVVVAGTRIIKSSVLNCVQTPFINMHMGITPQYRGVHGAYWALCCQDTANCGVTIHYVDKGVDTGSIIYQTIIQPASDDNFVTYPIVQLAKGLPLLIQAVDLIVKDEELITIEEYYEKTSRLWYHPTIFEYLKYWLAIGVK